MGDPDPLFTNVDAAATVAAQAWRDAVTGAITTEVERIVSAINQLITSLTKPTTTYAGTTEYEEILDNIMLFYAGKNITVGYTAGGAPVAVGNGQYSFTFSIELNNPPAGS